MKFSGDFTFARINLKRYEKALDEHMTEVIAKATLIWLQTVVNIIPVWSGASRATLVPLASEIQFGIPISPVARSRYDLGFSNADGKVEIDSSKSTYHLRYKTTLPHLIYNEFNNANIVPDATKFPPPAELHQPGPYGFQEKGQTAFREYASGVELPNPYKYLSISTSKF